MSCTSEHAQLTRCFVGIVVFLRSAFVQNMVFILNPAVFGSADFLTNKLQCKIRDLFKWSCVQCIFLIKWKILTTVEQCI